MKLGIENSLIFVYGFCWEKNHQLEKIENSRPLISVTSAPDRL
jgi:hypothetical protein